METKFISELNKILKNNNWLKKEESTKLDKLFILDKENNELFLLEKFKEYSLDHLDEYKMKFYIISEFIMDIGNKYNFSNQEIISILKDKLNNIIKNEKYENYSYALRVLFSINKNDNTYYLEQYDILDKINKLFHDINLEFLYLFIYI